MLGRLAGKLGLLSSPGPREGLWLGCLLSVLAALPFAFAVRPQQADFAAHLARYHVMLNQAESPFLSRYYDFQWALTGNIGVDLLMVPLGRLLGADSAAWLIAALLPVLTGLSIVSVEWALRRQVGPGGLLAFVFIWSAPMLMGFANFTLAIALALLAFALWVRLEGWRWRPALFTVIGVAVWLCHIAGWGVLGLLVFSYEWHRHRGPAAFLKPWPLFLPFGLIALGGGAAGTLNYGEKVASYKLSMWLKALAAHDLALDIASFIAVASVLLVAMLGRRLDGRVAWAALAVSACTIILPRHFGGGDLADLRLVPVAMLLGCLAISVQAPRWVLYLAPALFVVRLAVTTAEWKEDSARLEMALAGLEHIPAGARVAGAVALYPARWGADPLAHAPSYATVYRDALVNSHFAIAGIHMLRLREGGARFADPSQAIFAAPGEAVDLSSFRPAQRADYLWYFGENPVSRLPRGARILHRSRAGLLLELAAQPPAQTTGS